MPVESNHPRRCGISPGPVPDPSDEQLLADLRAGDLAAFDRLYARYERRVFGYLRRMLGDPGRAEDLLQEVFMKVFTDHGFDPDRGRFSAWLFTVARSSCLMELRSSRRRGAAHEAAPVPTPSRAPDELLEPSQRVERALATLSEPQRQLLLLKQVGQLTYGEIAAVIGVAEGTVKSRLHEATRRFRATLVQGES